jgi:prevent-host-death family protein
MPTTVTSRVFNQNRSLVKKAADKGPVIITDRGEPSYVLLRFEEFRRIAEPARPLGRKLAMPGGEDIEFDPPRLTEPLGREIDFG